MEDRPAAIIDVNGKVRAKRSGATAARRSNTGRAPRLREELASLLRTVSHGDKDAKRLMLQRELGHPEGRQIAAGRPSEEVPAAASDLGRGTRSTMFIRLAQRLGLPALSPALPQMLIAQRPPNPGL